jgi:hypothetical protein
MSNGVYVLPSAANGEVKPVVSSTPLVDFLMQLEDYTPTVGFPPEQGHLASVTPTFSHVCFPMSLHLLPASSCVFPSTHPKY